jgi:hypothetical protein
MSTALKPFGGGKQESLLEREFQDFHTTHPEIYTRLVSLARDLKRRGHERAGIAMLYEVVRWQQFTVNRDGDYKLNNNYRAYYARMMMEQETDLAGFFETRRVGAI